MEIIKFVESRIAQAALLVSIGATMLTGCTDYEGEANHFVISGPVVDVGERSVEILPLNVTEAHGAARGWFHSDNKTQVHNNYKNAGCKIKTVGHEFTIEAQPETLQDVKVGEWVQLNGRIQDSKVTCGKHSRWETRPVYTTLQEIPS